MYHKIKLIIGKGSLDFPNNRERVKHRLGFGSFNIHLRTSLKALRIDTALIYHAALLGITVSVLFVATELFLENVSTIVANTLYPAIYTILKCKSEQKASKSTWVHIIFYSPLFFFSSWVTSSVGTIKIWPQTKRVQLLSTAQWPATTFPDDENVIQVFSHCEWWHGITLNQCY